MPFIIHWVNHCEGEPVLNSINTPVGKLVVATQGGVITMMDWQLDAGNLPDTKLFSLEQFWTNPNSPIEINLLKKGSSYRQLVWEALSQIPIGETLTYSALAQKIGSAARAVGNACRDNPYPLIIPCHRIVSSAGLGGYCGATDGPYLAIKSKLLAFEANFSR